MKIIKSFEEWSQFKKDNLSHRTYGLVPTMGALHAGHISLINASQKENEKTIVSIFVNPTQFNQAEDLKHYPRPIEADLELLEKSQVDVCFLPDAETIYRDGYHFQIQENHLSISMEGAHRPGHFAGVLTVVMKLLNIIKPTRVYFGEKDYQQFLLIQNMVYAFFMDTEVKSCPTIRDQCGLALSSRNQRLSQDELELARQFAKIFHQPIPLIAIREQLNALKIPIDYLEEQNNRRFTAVYINHIRLIDNYAVDGLY